MSFPSVPTSSFPPLPISSPSLVSSSTFSPYILQASQASAAKQTDLSHASTVPLQYHSLSEPSISTILQKSLAVSCSFATAFSYLQYATINAGKLWRQNPPSSKTILSEEGKTAQKIIQVVSSVFQVSKEALCSGILTSIELIEAFRAANYFFSCFKLTNLTKEVLHTSDKFLQDNPSQTKILSKESLIFRKLMRDCASQLNIKIPERSEEKS